MSSYEMSLRPARRCSIDGDVMVNLAVLCVTDLRKAKSSIMIGEEYFSLPVTLGIGGCSSVPPNFGPGFCATVTPSSCSRKSRCHHLRLSSPSVMDSRPIASCLRTTSRIFSCAFDLSRPAGRSRLPTWSARKGGFMSVGLGAGVFHRLGPLAHLGAQEGGELAGSVAAPLEAELREP